MYNLKRIVIAVYVLFGVTGLYGKGASYSCNPVFPAKIDAKPGETVVLQGPDCFFLSALGSTFGSNAPVSLNITTFMPLTLAGDFTPIGLKYYPKKGGSFSFSYKPTEGTLKNQNIQVVIQSEPITQQFKDILQQQVTKATTANDQDKLATLSSILQNIDSKSLVRIYRRVPALGQQKFTPMHDMIFTTPAEQNEADIKLLPNGNLQIYERSNGILNVQEEPFGKL